jgi:phosphopantetheine adenylyltransferase/dephospho-CoA kinase
MLKRMIVGLTGGIASGKSHIAKDLAALGAAVIDADKLGHRAYEPGTSAFNAIVSEFGADVLDQAGDGKVVNRQRLGAIVFADEARMKKLTDIVWPVIKDLALREVAELRASGKHLIV